MDQNIGNEDISNGIDAHKHEQHEEVKEEQPEKGSDKAFLYIVIFIIIAFIVFFAIWFINKNPKVNTIDDLHALNLKGKLDPEVGYVYNKYSFVKNQDMWFSQVQARNIIWDIPFRYGPRDLEDLRIEGSLNEIFLNATEIYMTFDPLGSELQYIAVAVGEMDHSLVQAFNITPVAACDKNETEVCKTRPIETCEDRDKAIIYYKTNQTTRVIASGNCIIVQGTGFEITRAVDRVLMRMYGIMD